ncbi:hypothetical protein [Bacillus thuringiensis]|uniref:hypothetical protein n=1 Tax=Bacillus thuringiensis TaxID=1428 RepID=UPI0015CF33AB|nr:hypothetical protein [Bacillus thuringiensis]
MRWRLGALYLFFRGISIISPVFETMKQVDDRGTTCVKKFDSIVEGENVYV